MIGWQLDISSSDFKPNTSIFAASFRDDVYFLSSDTNNGAEGRALLRPTNDKRVPYWQCPWPQYFIKPRLAPTATARHKYFNPIMLALGFRRCSCRFQVFSGLDSEGTVVFRGNCKGWRSIHEYTRTNLLTLTIAFAIVHVCHKYYFDFIANVIVIYAYT